MSDIPSQQEEWAVGMAQAQRFAARENYFEAVGRVRAVRVEVLEALESAQRAEDIKLSGRLERFVFQVSAELSALEASHQAWNGRIADIRAGHLAGAAEEMARPLPNPVD